MGKRPVRLQTTVRTDPDGPDRPAQTAGLRASRRLGTPLKPQHNACRGCSCRPRARRTLRAPWPQKIPPLSTSSTYSLAVASHATVECANFRTLNVIPEPSRRPYARNGIEFHRELAACMMRAGSSRDDVFHPCVHRARHHSPKSRTELNETDDFGARLSDVRSYEARARADARAEACVLWSTLTPTPTSETTALHRCRAMGNSCSLVDAC